MRTWPLVMAIIIGAGIVAGAVLLRPSGFRECVSIISADIVHRNLTATLDPRDVETEAARTCAGAE
ncbi:hypothetical protein DMC47_13405 [Nostoc sp. 3335mG]|nr:hypothetical protein DMC47_13405 [Nostoc sp. 3335mG]